MIFSLIILMLFGAIVFFHYVQGLFSATLSAIIAVFAAIMAVSYHETIALGLLGGKYADYSGAMAMVVLFAAVYIVLRVVFDKLIPGNVMFPLWVDRIGGAIMGAVTAICATGTLAIAAQILPFGPSIAGYTRYDTQDREDIFVNPRVARGEGKGGPVVDELEQDSFEGSSGNSMLLPVDDAVLGLVSVVSDGGSMAGAAPLASVHPDYLQEAFAARLGLQVGAKRTAVNAGDARNDVSVQAVYTFASLPQVDTEYKEIRGGEGRTLPAELVPGDGQMLLVVRVVFDDMQNGDNDRIIRLSPGAVRLVGWREQGAGAAQWRNYYPVGTLNAVDQKVYANRVDDFLFINTGDRKSGADFVFVVDREDVVPASETGRDQVLKPGVFLEAKRLARVDLASKRIETSYRPADSAGVMLKAGVGPAVEPKPQPQQGRGQPGPGQRPAQGGRPSAPQGR